MHVQRLQWLVDMRSARHVPQLTAQHSSTSSTSVSNVTLRHTIVASHHMLLLLPCAVSTSRLLNCSSLSRYSASSMRCVGVYASSQLPAISRCSSDDLPACGAPTTSTLYELLLKPVSDARWMAEAPATRGSTAASAACEARGAGGGGGGGGEVAMGRLAGWMAR